jgi:hypothetical protein
VLWHPETPVSSLVSEFQFILSPNRPQRQLTRTSALSVGGRYLLGVIRRRLH